MPTVSVTRIVKVYAQRLALRRTQKALSRESISYLLKLSNFLLYLRPGQGSSKGSKSLDAEKAVRVDHRRSQAAEKVGCRRPAPKGASDFEELTASLKRCPDTKPEFFRSLLEFQRHQRQEQSRIAGDGQQNQQRSKIQDVEYSPRLLHRTRRQLPQTDTTRQRAGRQHQQPNCPPVCHLGENDQEHHGRKENQSRDNRQGGTDHERAFPLFILSH